MPRRLLFFAYFLVLFGGCTVSGSPSSSTSTKASPSSSHSPSSTEPGEQAGVYPDRITLTWAQDPASSLSVSWRTDTTVTVPKAQIAPASSSPAFPANARTEAATTHPLDVAGVPPDSVHAPYHYHSVTFSGLASSSTYAYRVGDGTHWSEWFHATTASAEPEPFSFIYLGDAQNDLCSHWGRAIRAAYASVPNASFMLHAGDLVDNADRTVEWARWHEAGDWIQSTIPTLPVPGNREYVDRDSAWTLPNGMVSGTPTQGRQLSVHWRPQFALPQNGPEGLKEQAYVLDHQGLRLIGLDPWAATADSAALPRQTEWLRSVLSETNARWTAVMLHIPIFSTLGDYEGLRQTWKPIFDEHQVDLVMQGHNHVYARGQVQNVTEGANVQSPSGTVYVTSIAGGKMLEIQDKRWTEYEDLELRRGGENTQLYQVVHVERDTLKYRSYTVTGERYDAFDLVKRPGDPPNDLIERLASDAEERRFENTISPEPSSQ